MYAKKIPADKLSAGNKEFSNYIKLVGILILREDYDTVPVVSVVNLRIATFSLHSQTVRIDTVFLGKDVVNALCTTF